MGLVRSFIGTDGIWQYIPHINTGLFSIIKVHFLLFANLIVDWHINTINFTDSGIIYHCIYLRTLLLINLQKLPLLIQILQHIDALCYFFIVCLYLKYFNQTFDNFNRFRTSKPGNLVIFLFVSPHIKLAEQQAIVIIRKHILHRKMIL